MSDSYYSDRTIGAQPRTEDEFSQAIWGGIVALVRSLLANGAFGYQFPENCEDRAGPFGADARNMGLALGAEIPDVAWPLSEWQVPPTLAILDLIEFCYRAVGRPIQGSYHPHFGHYHLTFDPDEGRASFRENINRMLARGGLCYELTLEGQIVRTVPAEVRDVLQSAQFRTGDSTLDELLETARQKYFEPDPRERKSALEKLWDAWERLKTIEPGAGKKESAAALLDRATSGPELRAAIEAEARELTRIGNEFGIRHSETSQLELNEGAHVDYFFHRLFAFVHMLLKQTGRA